jgi:hypothetical protein
MKINVRGKNIVVDLMPVPTEGGRRTKAHDDRRRTEHNSHANRRTGHTGEAYCLAHHVTVDGNKRGLILASLRYLDTFKRWTDRGCSRSASSTLTGWSNAQCRNEREARLQRTGAETRDDVQN